MDNLTDHALEALKILLCISGVFCVYMGVQFMLKADWPMFFFLLPINVGFIYYINIKLGTT